MADAMVFLVCTWPGGLQAAHDDEGWARQHAESIGGVVASCPIIADYRTADTADG